jgi:hypothetical protein
MASKTEQHIGLPLGVAEGEVVRGHLMYTAVCFML